MLMTTTVPTTNRHLLSGVEVLAEVLLARRALDERSGLDTATFVSGYPGSPLGGLDLALERLGGRLGPAKVHHQPGLNEELAAAAVWGSQMGEAVPYAGIDGVAGAWYGKGPGLDRCGDVLKHANYMGSGPGGGAVLFVGDDPTAKSSTLPYDTNLALADAGVPVLVPADQQDLFDLGVEAFRLSRFSGSWVGVRIVTAVADGIGTVDTSLDRFASGDPSVVLDGEPWRHQPLGRILGADIEELWLDRRLRAARGWVEARHLDRFVGADDADLGIVCSGRTFHDVLSALERCGVGPDDLADAGVRVLKLALTSPVVPERILELAGTADEIVVVEDKRPFIEQQVRAILHEAGVATPVRGKRDASGAPLVPMAGEIDATRLADVLTRLRPALAVGAGSGDVVDGPGPVAAGRRPRSDAGVLQRLPAQPLDGRARRFDHRRRRGLPRDDPLRGPARRRAVRAADADGRRGCALGRAGPVRR